MIIFLIQNKYNIILQLVIIFHRDLIQKIVIHLMKIIYLEKYRNHLIKNNYCKQEMNNEIQKSLKYHINNLVY